MNNVRAIARTGRITRMFQSKQRLWWALACAVLLSAGGTSVLYAGESARGRELRELLSKPVQFEGIDDPKVTFSEALDNMAKRYNLSFDINEQAFKDADLKEVARMYVCDVNAVPPMHTKVSRVLKRILARVSPSATYCIRDAVIEITTVKALRKEFYPNHPAGLLPPLVSGTFEKQSLEAVLKELARTSNSNVVLDARSAKEAAAPLTADFSNVPLDTAVAMMADMAGLKMVPLENVLYVTSKDNAATLMEEQKRLRLQRQQEQKEKAEKKKKAEKPDGKNDKSEPKQAHPRLEATTSKGGS
jgi:hypothetical protein